MAANEIHISDIGTTFRATVKDGANAIDLSTATITSIFFVFRDPGGTANTQTSTAFSDASTGVVDFTVTSAALFNTQGGWHLQLIVSTGTTTTNWHTDIQAFTVHPNL